MKCLQEEVDSELQLVNKTGHMQQAYMFLHSVTSLKRKYLSELTPAQKAR